MYVFLLVPPIIAFAYTGQDLASGMKVSIEQARAVALNAVPGTITDQELDQGRHRTLGIYRQELRCKLLARFEIDRDILRVDTLETEPDANPIGGH